MKSKFIILLIFIFVVTGCTRLENNIEFQSELLSNQSLVDTLKESEALFAYRFIEEESLITQEIFIWKNSLRIDLRIDLLKILEKLDKDSERVIQVSLFQLMKKDLDEQNSWYTSEASQEVIELLFPLEFNISSKTLYRDIMYMIIRLETLPEHHDTEVISLKTIMDINTNKNNIEKTTIHYIYD